MRFNPEDWKRKSHENFEGAWHEGPSVLTPAAHDETYPCRVYKRAQAHPVFATINRLRETYLSMGFDEAEVPVIIDEKDIYRQFGPEAMAVLDRVFYLGGLPRPNVGIAANSSTRSTRFSKATRIRTYMSSQLLQTKSIPAIITSR